MKISASQAQLSLFEAFAATPSDARPELSPPKLQAALPLRGEALGIGAWVHVLGFEYHGVAYGDFGDRVGRVIGFSSAGRVLVQFEDLGVYSCGRSRVVRVESARPDSRA